MVFKKLSDLKKHVGTSLGTSSWKKISQQEINAFAQVTGDKQWIHIDPEKAKKESPFGNTVAHGYFTLSLVSILLPEIFVVQSVKSKINYGANQIRFTAPVYVDSKVRLSANLKSVKKRNPFHQVTIDCTMYSDRSNNPVMIAEILMLMTE